MVKIRNVCLVATLALAVGSSVIASHQARSTWKPRHVVNLLYVPGVGSVKQYIDMLMWKPNGFLEQELRQFKEPLSSMT